MRTILGHRVFIASPGGLGSERDAIRDVMARYNQEQAMSSAAAFFPFGWEQVQPGAGRGQALINEEIAASDYMILLFRDRWGTPPGINGPYSSGTEEEFFEAVRHLEDSEMPMRNILVLFATIDDARLRDPGSDLQKVLDFRNKLEKSKQILFGTFDELASLRDRVDRSLQQWSQGANSPKRVIKLNLAPDGFENPAQTEDAVSLVSRASALAASSLHLQAEVLFARASTLGSPAAQSAYAKYMRRRGHMKAATEINQALVESLSAKVTRSEEEESILIETLANIAVIAKSRGQLTEAVRGAREAVATAQLSPVPIPGAHAYALDVLGNMLEAAGDTDGALESFQSSLVLRTGSGVADDQSQSNINIARLQMRSGSVQNAITSFSAAIEVLDASTHAELLAKAHAGRSAAYEKCGQSDRALEDAEESLRLNEHSGNSDGISISLGRLARLALAQEDPSKAKTYIDRMSSENATSGSVVGKAEILRLTGLVKALEGDLGVAVSLLADAIEQAKAIGNGRLLTSIERDWTRVVSDSTNEI